MRLLKSFALALQLISVLSSAIFAWALWYLFSNPPLSVDGPKPNTMEYFLTLDRWTQLTFVSVGVFLVLSFAGFLSALALYRGRNSGRVGLAVVTGSLVVMVSIDWVLEGLTRDLLTCAAIGVFAAFSIWLLFFYPPLVDVFKRQRAASQAEA